MNLLEQTIARNVERIRQRIAAAAQRGGRDPNEVTLIAITKYVGLAELRAVVAAGCLDIGESRPQDLWTKAETLAGQSIRWHMIGHLQRNKIRRTLPYLTCLHSGDSPRLLQAVDRIAAEQQRTVPVLLEINISGDPSKHGFAPGDVEAAVPELAALKNLRLDGLMAMAGRSSSAEEARKQFAAVRQLRDRLREASSLPLDQLSMGMSGDFEQAVEEGATLVRVGSSLFEDLPA